MTWSQQGDELTGSGETGNGNLVISCTPRCALAIQNM
jgi:hypothetical protein